MKKEKSANRVLKTFLEYSISIAMFIVIWQIYIVVCGVESFMLPSPASVFKKLGEVVVEGEIWGHFAITTGEVLLGFFIGSILGIILGYVIGKSQLLKDALMPYLIFIQTAPKIALVPLFVIWFGLGLTSKIVLIVSMVLFPVMAGTMVGIGSIPKEMKNLMKIINASKLQTIIKMELPAATPMIFSGLKIGIVQAIIGAIVAEWMSGKQGLGYILTYASSVFDTELLIAGIIFTIMLGIIFYEIIDILERKLLYWHESQQ